MSPRRLLLPQASGDPATTAASESSIRTFELPALTQHVLYSSLCRLHTTNAHVVPLNSSLYFESVNWVAKSFVKEKHTGKWE